MSEVTELRKFVIRHFLITLITVGIAEFLISAFISHTLLPAIIRQFFPELYDFNVFSTGNLVVLVLAIGLYSLFNLIGKLIPFGGDIASATLNESLKYFGIADQVPRDNTILSKISSLTVGDILILVILILGLLIIVLFPVLLGSMVFARKVTRQFKMLDEQRAAEQKESERKKYLMISDIAHDLKTPMTTVSGYARALSDGMVSKDKEQEYLEAITSKTERMNDIVQMLFNYVRLDSDGFDLVRAPVDICELVRECAALAYQDVEDAGMEFDIDIPEEKIMVSADKIQMSRVVTNLLTNAVKHNDKGTHIGVKVTSDSDDTRIYISDSGKEIDKELASDIFEPFVMGDKSRSSKGGSGLGLSIARKVVELHGWKIKLVQRPEIGRYHLGDIYGKVFVIIIPNIRG